MQHRFSNAKTGRKILRKTAEIPEKQRCKNKNKLCVAEAEFIKQRGS
ncbi:hypothetical protein EDF67_11528 [Sphingobacterium sp. JUb78]|nr:hypothetical protein L950_0223570 [Sphingobacterium sp. IITKGP-BTPF85]MCW2260488.1 hypothetical protein [Sphingobacterium kitahiroshimense]TCR00937.1 hypothetical protein EDF67_11528 [Sphingobacterium sp. JUb78]